MTFWEKIFAIDKNSQRRESVRERGRERGVYGHVQGVCVCVWVRNSWILQNFFWGLTDWALFDGELPLPMQALVGSSACMKTIQSRAELLWLRAQSHHHPDSPQMQTRTLQSFWTKTCYCSYKPMDTETQPSQLQAPMNPRVHYPPAIHHRTIGPMHLGLSHDSWGEWCFCQACCCGLGTTQLSAWTL